MPTAIVVRLVFWVWLGTAFVIGRQQLLMRIPPVAVQGILLSLTAILLAAYFRVTAVKTWVDSLDLRAILLLHVTRFVGVYFLILYGRGQLPYDFAVPGGIGDIIVASLALVLAVAPLAKTNRLRAIRIWNIVGLIDISLVVLTAARLNLDNPLQMRALTYLPLSLLPTFLVPLIIATHIIVFTRLSRDQGSA